MKKFSLPLAGSVGLLAIATSASVIKPAIAETINNGSQKQEVAQVMQQVNSDLYFNTADQPSVNNSSISQILVKVIPTMLAK
jgi:hypothetical protein